LKCASARHDIQRIHEQVDEDSLDALPIHSDDQILRHVLNDLNRLRFGKESDFAYGAGYQLTKIGRLYAIVRSSVPV
jgi:hypothetical protein